jgi:hypothetical protein
MNDTLNILAETWTTLIEEARYLYTLRLAALENREFRHIARIDTLIRMNDTQLDAVDREMSRLEAALVAQEIESLDREVFEAGMAGFWVPEAADLRDDLAYQFTTTWLRTVPACEITGFTAEL